MKEFLIRIIGKILDYFFNLFHIVGDCFRFQWTPEGKKENILGILKAALVVLPIVLAVVFCFMHYSNNPFVPSGNSPFFGFETIKKYYIFDGIIGGALLIACIVFLIRVRRGPDMSITIKIILFNLIFVPVIIFCATNLYTLIVLAVLIVVIVVLGKILITRNSQDRTTRQNTERNGRFSVTETEGYMPPALNNQPYTANKNGNKFRVKNAHRVKVYVAPNGEMMVATNSFGEPSVDLGPERDFRNGKLYLYDENNNPISTRNIRHIK